MAETTAPKITSNMEEVYGWLKSCLNFFDLPWGHIDHMKVSFGENSITAAYGGETITWKLDDGL